MRAEIGTQKILYFFSLIETYFHKLSQEVKLTTYLVIF